MKYVKMVHPHFYQHNWFIICILLNWFECISCMVVKDPSIELKGIAEILIKDEKIHATCTSRGTYPPSWFHNKVRVSEQDIPERIHNNQWRTNLSFTVSMDMVGSVFMCWAAEQNRPSRTVRAYAKIRSVLETDTVSVIIIISEWTDNVMLIRESLERYGYKYKMRYLVQKDKKESPISKTRRKLQALRGELSRLDDKENSLVLYSSGSNILFTNTPQELVHQFAKFKARVVFSSDEDCWPVDSFMFNYPMARKSENRFLSSLGLMGYAREIHAILDHLEQDIYTGDQLLFTTLFLDSNLREQWGLQIDKRNKIFQTINQNTDKLQIESRGNRKYVYNNVTGASPIAILANKTFEREFTRFAKLITDRCMNQVEEETNTVHMENLHKDYLPVVCMSYLVYHATPFLEESLKNIRNLDYPKSQLHLFIHNKIAQHGDQLAAFVQDNRNDYTTIIFHSHVHPATEGEGVRLALEHVEQKSCRYYFMVESLAQLTDPSTLRTLIHHNRTLLSPMLTTTKPEEANFWGSVDSSQLPIYCPLYEDIVRRKTIGTWRVPLVFTSILVHVSLLPDIFDVYDASVARLREIPLMKLLWRKDFPLFVTNSKPFGHVVDHVDFDVNKKHGEMWNVLKNPLDWEERYLHPDYWRTLDRSVPILQPCPDVFWFPFTTKRFAHDLIDIMETFGQWSKGRDHHEDPRIDGGYENYPTVDIIFYQVGLQEVWMHVLRTRMYPVQVRVFEGHDSGPPSDAHNFVVRYRPDEQAFLNRHEDSSVYTMNMALNTVGKDYEGGGCRFHRYNCSVTSTRLGWALIHPGQLTHAHEGLPTTKGTRYLLVSFIN